VLVGVGALKEPERDLDTGMAIGRSVQISSIKQQQINVAQK
jgi:hypothetical protein